MVDLVTAVDFDALGFEYLVRCTEVKQGPGRDGHDQPYRTGILMVHVTDQGSMGVISGWLGIPRLALVLTHTRVRRAIMDSGVLADSRWVRLFCNDAEKPGDKGPADYRQTALIEPLRERIRELEAR